MVCTACGREQVVGAQFCRGCGAHIAPEPPPAPRQQAWMPPNAYPPQYGAMVAEQRMRVRQNRQPWARPLAIIFGVLALLKIPFGTALGIYTLWVLAPRASWAEWESLSRPA